jgi:hypothetical protein
MTEGAFNLLVVNFIQPCSVLSHHISVQLCGLLNVSVYEKEVEIACLIYVKGNGNQMLWETCAVSQLLMLNQFQGVFNLGGFYFNKNLNNQI